MHKSTTANPRRVAVWLGHAVPSWLANLKRRGLLGAAAGTVAAVGAASAAWALAVGGPASTAAAAASGPQQGGTIYYGGEQEPPCLGQVQWVQEAYIARQILDSLVEVNNQGQIIPWLATSWTVSPTGKTYTFKLKPNVKFTDGTPLNAAAVVANFNWWYNPKTLNGSNEGEFPFYKSSRAINNLTFQLNLTQAYSPLLATIAQAYFGIESPKSLKRSLAKICDDPIGTGPFILQAWNHGQNLIFVRNPHYNSAPANALHQGPAYVSKLVWGFVSDPTTRYGALGSGQLDAIYDVPTIDWQAAKSQYTTLTHIEGGKPVTLNINTKGGPFADIRVREAFAYGTNRKAAVESAYDGVVPYAGNGALTESTPDYDASLANAFSYNPTKANQLLNAAGWTGRDSAGYRTKNGKTLTVRIIYGAGSIVTQEGVTVLQDVQQEAKAAGFDVVLVPATLAQLFSGAFSKPSQYDAIAGYFTHDSPGVLWAGVRQFNQTFYSPPALLNATSTAVASSNPAVQQKNWDIAQELLVNNAVLVGLYPQPVLVAVNKRLHDVWLEGSQGEPVFSDAYFTK